MNDPLLQLPPAPPLLSLLQEHFSPETLEALVGPDAAELGELWQSALIEPLKAFLSHPGKGLRADFMHVCFKLAGGDGPCPLTPILMIEALHAGSLIVDDIEDDSQERRGAPTLHRSHGMPKALNAGNWLYFWALSLVEKLELPAGDKLRLLIQLNTTLLQCHHGQALDLTARASQLSKEEMPRVVLSTTQLKTGALMKLSALVAAIVAGAPPREEEAVSALGSDLGIALQMLDDLSGLLSSKRAHKGLEDLTLSRPTWPWAWLAADLSPSAFEKLQVLAREVEAGTASAEELRGRLRVALRGSGRVYIRRHINQALLKLEGTLGESEALNLLRENVKRLEKSYG